MRIAFKPLARLQALHAYRQGGIAALGVIVPEPTRSMLGGARTLARMVDGRLMLAWEADELGAPLVSLAGRSLLFGLRLADAGFDRYTEPPIADAPKLPLYENRSSRQSLDAPTAVRLLARGDAAPDAIVDAELALAAPWALLRLQVDASLYATPAELAITLAARRDMLRYYVVAQRYSAAEFDQVQVVDEGFDEDARSELQFTRVPSSSFGAGHLATDVLDAAGTARIALFESQQPVERRAQALRRLQLRRNGDVLVEHLPSPGASRADAQFVIHLGKP